MPVALLSLLLCAQGCQSHVARDYYFSPTGDDAGQGTLASPFRSVDRANQLQFGPGDRVLFEGGQTFTGSLTLTSEDAGTPDQPLRIGSYGTGRATIDAGNGSGIDILNAGGIEVQDLVLRGAGPASNNGSGVSAVNTLRGGARLAYLRVRNIEASGFGKEGIFVCGKPSDDSASGFQDVLIEDCVLRKNQHTGVYVTGRWRARWREQPHAFAHRNVRVVRCLAEDNSGDPAARGENRSGSGILLDSVDGGVIEYCEARGNGGLNRSKHGGPVGIWCTISNNVAIQYCKSHRNRTGAGHDGGGFCLDGGVCNSVLQYNWSEENDGSGYGLYEYPGAPPAFGNIIRHNVSRNDGRRNGYAGIHIWDDAGALRHVSIHSNEVYMDRGPAEYRPTRALWVQSGIRSAKFAQNRFTVGPGVRLMDVAPKQQNVTFLRNVYQTPGDPIAVEWQGREFTSLREWLRATGQASPPTGQASSPTGQASSPTGQAAEQPTPVESR